MLSTVSMTVLEEELLFGEVIFVPLLLAQWVKLHWVCVCVTRLEN